MGHVSFYLPTWIHTSSQAWTSFCLIYWGASQRDFFLFCLTYYHSSTCTSQHGCPNSRAMVRRQRGTKMCVRFSPAGATEVYASRVDRTGCLDPVFFFHANNKNKLTFCALVGAEAGKFVVCLGRGSETKKRSRGQAKEKRQDRRRCRLYVTLYLSLKQAPAGGGWLIHTVPARRPAARREALGGVWSFVEEKKRKGARKCETKF